MILGLFILLFYASPFSERPPRLQCISYPHDTAGPAGAQTSPVCGGFIGGKDYSWPNFPFKDNTNERIEFCKNNLKNIEEECGFNVNFLLIEDYIPPYPPNFFTCDYIGSGNYSLENFVSITRYRENYTPLSSTDGVEVRKIGNSLVYISHLSGNTSCNFSSWPS